MTLILIATSNVLHALATVIFTGHYLLLSLVYLPGLTRLENEAGAALSEISRRSRPWLYASLLVFMLTGTYLMLVDPNYMGIGNFGNPWAVLMLLKHILIVGMIAVGFWFNAILRVGPMLRSNSGAALALGNFQRYCHLMAASSALVLVLTAISQAQ